MCRNLRKNFCMLKQESNSKKLEIYGELHYMGFELDVVTYECPFHYKRLDYTCCPYYT